MNGHSTVKEIYKPLDSNQEWGSTPAQKIGLTIAGIALIILVGVFPYQHGTLLERNSIITGLLSFVKYNSEWMYCPLIPFIVAYLVYRAWPDLRLVPTATNLFGFFILLFGLLIYWSGYKADQRMLGYAAIQIITAGIIIAILGWRFFMAVFFFWIFLAFTWPIKPLEDLIAVPLRYVAAICSTALLNLVGTDTIREGTNLVSAPQTISANNDLFAASQFSYGKGDLFSLGVDVPCSGLRSLFALIMITVLYAYLSLRNWGTRITLIALSIPIAIIGNIIRMLLLVYGTILLGSEFAIGTGDDPSTYHLGSGFAIFGVALISLFLLSNLLERFDTPPTHPNQKNNPTKTTTKKHHPAALATLLPGIAMLTTIALCLITPVAKKFAPPGVVETLPTNYKKLTGVDSEITAAERSNFGPTGTAITRRVYTNNESQKITVNIILNKAIENIHKPEVCLPSQDWKLLKLHNTDITPTALDRPVPVHIYTCQNRANAKTKSGTNTAGIHNMLYLYTFVGHHRITPKYNDMKLLSALDNFIHNINHRWAMISITQHLPPGELSETDYQTAIDNFKIQIADLLGQIIKP